MRRILILAFVCSLALTPIGVSSPIDGAWSNRVDITASDTWKTTRVFRAGERAGIMVIGDHQKEIPNLEVSVYDKKGNLIVEDKGVGVLVGDFAAVIWYPPRDGEYRIEVRNPGKLPNRCYISIK